MSSDSCCCGSPEHNAVYMHRCDEAAQGCHIMVFFDLAFQSILALLIIGYVTWGVQFQFGRFLDGIRTMYGKIHEKLISAMVARSRIESDLQDIMVQLQSINAELSSPAPSPPPYYFSIITDTPGASSLPSQVRVSSSAGSSGDVFSMSTHARSVYPTE